MSKIICDERIRILQKVIEQHIRIILRSNETHQLKDREIEYITRITGEKFYTAVKDTLLVY